MSFQFPANPKDGDVVIRLINGTSVKGVYNEDTNTWEVGELPEEPGVPGPAGPKGEQGEKGDPGQGLQVSGIVETENNLPPPNDHTFQFWLVDDTNTLFYSDGNEWSNLGSPIQGPAGNDGADGADGTNGLNGAPGKGWYDTQIIDQRPGNYQISFLSNDGLQFTTDNIMGPQGETGSLQVATATTIGGIKIGRGLDIAPDGTASAGVTTVNLETVPLNPDGNPANINFMTPYAPIYRFMGQYRTESWEYARNDYDYESDSMTIKMPSTANKALVFYFGSSTMKGSPTTPYDAGNMRSFRLYASHQIGLTNAIYTSGRTTDLGMANVHNLAYLIDSQALERRQSTTPTTKINQIEFAQGGTEVTFDYNFRIHISGWNELTAGGLQVIIIPFRDVDTDVDEDGEGFSLNVAPPGTVVKDGSDFYYTREADGSVPDDVIPTPPTPEELNKEAGEDYRQAIEYANERINNELVYVQGTPTGDQLIAYRDELRAVRDLPGSAEDVGNALIPIINGINSLLAYTFRFE